MPEEFLFFKHTVKGAKAIALSDLRIKQAKPKDKRYTLADGRELLFEIRPNGQKYWIVRAWLNGKEKRRYIGKYPEMPLKEARIKAVITRNEIFNPEIDSQRNKITLKEVADEWLKKRMSDKKKTHILRLLT